MGIKSILTARTGRHGWPVLAAVLSLPAVAVFVLALHAAGGARPAPSGDAAAADVVATVEVGRAAAQGSFELDGSLESIRQSTLGAQIGGNVVALNVKAGDRVKAGQVLARIDARETQAGLARGDAQVSQAAAALASARLNAQRPADLRAQGFVSQAALDVARTQLEAAEGAMREAQAARAQAALARGFADVTAPFDAVVLATFVEAGDLATPGRPLLSIHDPARIRAVVQVPASRAADARGARRTEVRLPDGEWVAPVASTELPSADAVSQTVEWRLDLPAAAVTKARTGQTVRVRFLDPAQSTAAQRLSVPAAAIVRRGELTAVYVAQGSRFALRAVRLGSAAADGFEVVAGLRDGERVAVDGVRAGLLGAAPAAVRSAQAAAAGSPENR